MLKDGTYLVKNDGTIENYAERWSYGFFVGEGDKGYRVTKGDYPADNGDLLAISAYSDQHLVGVWTAPDGCVYIDPVTHVGSWETAFALATQRGELAIWDAFLDKCIYT